MSKQPQECGDCRRFLPLRAKGLCNACYQRSRRRIKPEWFKTYEKAQQRKHAAKRKERAKAWRAANGWRETERRRKRAERIEAIKTARPCMDCSRYYPAECMDFDHRDNEEKLFDISKRAYSGCKWESIVAEIAKCDLVCANCHRIRTKQRKKIAKRLAV